MNATNAARQAASERTNVPEVRKVDTETSNRMVIPTGYAVARVDTEDGKRIYQPLRYTDGGNYQAIGGPKRSHYDACIVIYREVALGKRGETKE